jgi:hypothetical protein
MGGVLSLALLLALTTAPANDSPKQQSPGDGDDKVVCRLITEAGSRIPFRVCRTAGEWERMAKENQDDWTNSRNSREIGCNKVDCK